VTSTAAIEPGPVHVNGDRAMGQNGSLVRLSARSVTHLATAVREVAADDAAKVEEIAESNDNDGVALAIECVLGRRDGGDRSSDG